MKKVTHCLSNLRLLWLAAVMACTACQPGDSGPTAYDAELQAIAAKLAEIEADDNPRHARARDVAKIYQLYQRATLTGDYADYHSVDDAIKQALAAYGASEELLLLEALLDVKLHRLGEATADLDQLAQVSRHLRIDVLRADIALQQGRYQEALNGYQKLVEESPSWDNLARLAFYKAKTGNPKEADELYAEAGEKLSAKEMRSFAWVELQRGLLDLDFHNYHEALAHYRRADRAYSGYWLVEEHIAEALQLTGQTDEAVALYREIIAKTDNPEFVVALADILQERDSPAADALYRQADQLFQEQYALYPDAARGHYIEHLLQRPEVDSRLLEYAQRNHEVRPNGEAKFLLAQAYLKLNDEASARNVMGELLESPWRTPDIQSLAHEMGML